MDALLERLREGKIVQWALPYMAGAWLILQVLDIAAEPWGFSLGLVRGIQLTLVFGFLVAPVARTPI